MLGTEFTQVCSQWNSEEGSHQGLLDRICPLWVSWAEQKASSPDSRHNTWNWRKSTRVSLSIDVYLKSQAWEGSERMFLFLLGERLFLEEWVENSVCFRNRGLKNGFWKWRNCSWDFVATQLRSLGLSVWVGRSSLGD